MEASNKMLSTVEALQKSITVLETSIERYSTKLETVSEQIKQVTFYPAVKYLFPKQIAVSVKAQHLRECKEE